MSLTATIVLLALAPLAIWLARWQQKRNDQTARCPDGSIRMINPQVQLYICIAALVVFAPFLFILPFVAEPVELWVILVFVACTAAALLYLADYIQTRHTMTSSGVCYGRLWHGRNNGFASWQEMTQMRYSAFFGYFHVQTASGVAFKVGSSMSGLQDFAANALDKCTKMQFSPGVKEILEQAREGRMPGV